MMQPNVTIAIDHEAGAAYIRLSAERVARTAQVTDQFLVDLDAMGVAVGIEVLALSADIPYERLEQDCHVHSDAIAAVKAIRPSVAGFFFPADSRSTRPRAAAGLSRSVSGEVVGV